MAAFIFDMDGTIVDNMDVHMEIWMRVFAAHGLHVSKEEFYRHSAGKTNPEILSEYLGLEPADAARVAEEKEQLYRDEYGPALQLVKGAYEFLEQSRRLKIPLALATSAPPANVEFVLDRLQLSPYFDAVVHAAQVKNGKPHPEMFFTAAGLLGVPPDQCIVFEDAPAGIEAARRAGMKTVVLTTTLHPDELPGLGPVLASADDFTTLDPSRLARLPA